MPNQPTGQRRVLVVDDHPVNRKLLQIIVQEMNWECVLAASGADAVAACGQGAFDLVLMDYRMPGMDGCQATLAIRALGGWAEHVPVIGITADDNQIARSNCISSGMLACIGKPIHPLAVSALMRRALESNQSEAPRQKLAYG